MNQITVTERLYLRELTFDDAAFIVSLVNTPGWLQYVGDRNIATKEDAIGYLTNGPMSGYNKYGFGLWAVCLKKKDIPIGICGVFKRDTTAICEIGFALLPEFEGVGYAHEAVKATIEVAKSQFDLKDLTAVATKDNARSIALLQRIGFRKSEENVPAENGVELLQFEMKLSG